MRRLTLVVPLLAVAAAFASPALADPGDLDPQFGGGTVTTAVGAYSFANTTVTQADGRIVAVGTGTDAHNHSAFALVRYTKNGALDSSFGSHGIVTTAILSNAGGADAVLQPDGKIVVAGSASDTSGKGYFALARYNPSGSLDASFGSGGIVTTALGFYSNVAGVALQADGKIVAAGATDVNDTTVAALVRYNPNGSLDPTFGSGGKVRTPIGPYAFLSDVAIQTDGRIVAAGSGVTSNYEQEVAVLRYLTNGSLDPTFGSGGKVLTKIGYYAFGTSLAIQSDGRLVVGADGVDANFKQVFALARYKTDGSLDTSFGSSGVTTLAIGSVAFANSVALQSDGKIVEAGGNSSGGAFTFALARFTANGTLDPSFGTGGIVLTRIGRYSSAEDVAVQADGKILAAGEASPTGDNETFALARYTPGGSLDTGFGGGSTVTTSVGSGGGEANAVALQADGKIVAAGYSSNGQTKRFALVRYNPDGSLDQSFGTGGRVITPIGSGNSSAEALVVLASGKIVAAGYSGKRFALARYNPNGSLDPNFGVGGIVTTAIGSGDVAQALAVQSNGKLVAAGSSLRGSRPVFAAARYSSTGVLDPSFGSGGTVTTALGPSDDEAEGLALQGDGKIVLAGFSRGANGDRFALVRYTSSGAPDSSFGFIGAVTTPIGSSSRAHTLALQADGKLVAAGQSTSSFKTSFALARYRADGTLDPAFGAAGTVTTQIGTLTDVARALVVQPNGKLVAAGESWQRGAFLSGGDEFALVRYEPSGALATGFGSGGKVLTPIGPTADANALALQTDGKLVAAGESWNGSSWDFALARYLGS
jgi:uncharacterized delta-60 repeat protein